LILVYSNIVPIILRVLRLYRFLPTLVISFKTLNKK